MVSIKVGTDFSGIGSPEQALKELQEEGFLNYKSVFACEIDKFARKSYKAIHGKVKTYNDITKRNHSKIPKLDLYVAGFPCQSFSIAGKQKGFDDVRGTLFFNVADFIKINQPECFILENVKGLLSHDKGKTFQTIIDLLSNGGGTVNGQMSLDFFEDGLGYHINYQVLNTKEHGIPQNRERIFIVGFKESRDYRFPKKELLNLKLRDVLENDVNEKYFLSEKMVSNLVRYNERQIENGNGFSSKFRDINDVEIMDTLKVGGGGKDDLIKVGYINQDTQASKVISEDGISSTLSAGTHGYAQGYIEINSATKDGFEKCKEGDSINLNFPKSKTRRGRVGKSVAQTLDTSCNQGVVIGSLRGRNPDNPKSRKSGLETKQMLEINQKGTSNCLTSVNKDNLVILYNTNKNSQGNRIYDDSGIATTQNSEGGGLGGKTGLYNVGARIRRLTPLECWRLQGFSDESFYKAQKVNSDTQLYRQAGNTITTRAIKKKIINIYK